MVSERRSCWTCESTPFPFLAALSVTPCRWLNQLDSHLIPVISYLWLSQIDSHSSSLVAVVEFIYSKLWSWRWRTFPLTPFKFHHHLHCWTPKQLLYYFLKAFWFKKLPIMVCSHQNFLYFQEETQVYWRRQTRGSKCYLGKGRCKSEVVTVEQHGTSCELWRDVDANCICSLDFSQGDLWSWG